MAENVNVYEGLFILDSNRYARDAAGAAKQLTDLVEKCGGSIMASRMWEERRLAYPIKGQRKGTYWLMYFKLDGSQATTLRRECQLNESIVRHLFLKVDPRIVEALVSHALAGPAATRRSAEPVAAHARIEVPDVPEDLGN